MEDTFKKFHGFSFFFFFKDLNKNPMIFVGEKGVCIKNIFMDFDQNKANGFYYFFKKKTFGFQKIP